MSNALTVFPLDVTFMLPMQFEQADSSTDPLPAVYASLSSPGHHWRPVDPVRRGGLPELDGFAFGEFAYFHPYFQKFIYQDSCRVYQFDREQARTLHVDASNPKLVLDIRNVFLYVFEPGIGVLVTELRLPEGCQATWADALYITAELRKAYYSHYYRKEGEWLGGGGIAEVRIEPLQPDEHEPRVREIRNQLQDALDSKTPRLFPHWKALLFPLWDSIGQTRIRLLGDSRLPVMAFIGVPDISALSPDDWEALAQADGADYAKYAPQFRDRELERAVYDRWFDPESGIESHRQRYVVGPLSCCTVIQVDPNNIPPFLFGSREKWRRQYFILYLFAVYQMSVLRVVQKQIADVSDLLAEAVDRERSRRALNAVLLVQRNLVQFSSRAWFLEVTPQIQGKELYEKMRVQFRVDALYPEIVEDKKILSDWISTQDTVLREEWRDNLQRMLLLPVTVSIAVTGLGMSVIWDTLRKFIPYAQLPPLAGSLKPYTQATYQLLADAVMIVIAVVAAYLFYRTLSKKIGRL